MAERFGGNVDLFEFKVVELEPEGAVAQLRERDYAAKYRGGGRGGVPGGRGVQQGDEECGGVRGGVTWADRAHSPVQERRSRKAP